MDTRKTFCEKCRDDVNYNVISTQMVGKIKDKEYQYIGKEARCKVCNSLVYVHELNDYNLRSLYDVYRKENDIVSFEVISDIPKKYNIGKRPLSLLLGWGEQTFSRYCEGDIPTKQYSDILNRIYQNPAFYSEILESNKDKLKSKHSYEKSRRAVEALLEKSANTGGKMNLVAKYLINECEDITPLALQKALYYIQGFYYAFYKTFVFSEDCQAWAHGPVYPDIYYCYKNYHYDPIKKIGGFDSSVFSVCEKEIYDSVINNICCYSGKVLEQFTHNELPWVRTRGELKNNEPSTCVIEKSLIGTYFESVKEKYNIINPDDVKKYASYKFSNY